MEVAQRSTHAGILTATYSSAALYHVLRQGAAAAQRDAEEAIRLIETLGVQGFFPRTITAKAPALIVKGSCKEGIERMRRAISAYRAGWTTPPRWASSFLAQELGKIGRYEEGFKALEEGFACIAKAGEQNSSPLLHHSKGELFLAQTSSRTTEAEQCFRIAIEIARGQSVRMEELRATTSLARLLASQGRHDEARTMLAEIYGWFTEGFDTADLKDAKALLDELAAIGCA